MKKKYIAFSCAAALSLILASCASKPKVEEPVKQDPKPVQKVEEVVEEPAVEEQEDNSSALEADANARAQADDQYQKALQAKEKIDENGFASYSQDDYDNGNSLLSEFESKKDSENVSGKELLDLADSAYGKYQNVLFKAYKKLAKDARVAAFTEKKNADSVKAAAAAKVEYSSATEEFKAGDSNYAMQNPESAYNHYIAAKEKFAAMYASVSVKRAEAQKAIDEAKEKVLNSENYAINADHEKPLEGDNIEGIEAEDAVLLEADNYESSEALESEIPAVIDELEVEEPAASPEKSENEADAQAEETPVENESAAEAVEQEAE